MINKTLPKKPRPDVCQRSLDWLEDHAISWFSKNVPNHGKIWFSDENSKHILQEFPKSGELVEIILTGSFLNRLLESNLWYFENFRLWTFSSRVKSFLVSSFGFSEEQIGVIGRTAPSKLIAKPDFQQDINLVYAGRLSLAKNITAIIRLASELQTNHHSQVTLDIFGLPDDLADPSLGRFQPYIIEDEIQNLIQQLTWQNRPVFHQTVPQKEWLKINRPSPVFISLSTSMHEDFGTAAEIATQYGWPSLLSDWGGHADACFTHKIPHQLVARTHEPEFIQVQKTKMLANQLMTQKWELSSYQNISFLSQPLDRNSLKNLIDIFVKKWSPEILLCLRNEMIRFADTNKGRELFKCYHSHFGKNTCRKAVIVNDLKANPLYQLPSSNEPYELIFVRDLFSSFYMNQWNNFDLISLINLGDEAASIIHFFKTTLGLSAKINVFTDDEEKLKNFDFLSANDQVLKLSV
ncbi:MAG: glycosyltransferase [Bacteriovoracia bacterium]